jgi:phosphate-selective porin OprO/OprP
MRFQRLFRLAGPAACAALSYLPAAADDGWTTSFYGRLVYDVSTWKGDRTGLDTSSGEVRQALLGINASSGNWTFSANALTATGIDPEIENAWLEYRPGGGSWGIRAGQFKTPNSLDEQTSSLNTSTAERAAFTDAFGFDRRLGIALTGSGERYTAMAGLFAANINDTFTREGHAAAARVTFVPWRGDDWTSHLGLSARWREGGDDLPLLRNRQRPYAHQSGAILSTGSVFGSDLLVAAEAAVLYRRSWAAAEFAAVEADLAAGGSADFSGGYLEAGHVFGGHKTYGHGRFEALAADRPVSEGGPGALAVAVRIDTVDLSGGGVDGGDLTSEIMDITWVLDRHLLLRLDLFCGDAALGAPAAGLDPVYTEAILSGLENETVSGATLRFQASF